MRQHREHQRRVKEHTKYIEKLRAENEAEQFDRYLELLVSIHKNCTDDLDWEAIANSDPPAPPTQDRRHEVAATMLVAAYKPGFFERLFGGAAKRLAVLQQGIMQGRAADHAAYLAATQAHAQAHASWATRRTLAQRILARDPGAYSLALEALGALEDLESFETEATLGAAEPDGVTFTCRVMDDEIVPREEVKLTSRGKTSTKAMAAGRYWALYQDHVCSTALRLAREAFAVLPVSRAIVNIGPMSVNPQTGHREHMVFLAVHLARDAFKKLNLNNVDPSDSMKNFPHRMKFKKTTGFEPVMPMTLDENWMTSG